MLKFLTDENVFPSTLHILRSHNFDVKDIKELGLTGISDQAVMDLAKKEGRIIVSLDLHFANVSLFPLVECPGIIVIRVKPAIPPKVDKAMESFLRRMDPIKIENALVIVSEDKFRIRRY